MEEETVKYIQMKMGEEEGNLCCKRKVKNEEWKKELFSLKEGQDEGKKEGNGKCKGRAMMMEGRKGI